MKSRTGTTRLLGGQGLRSGNKPAPRRALIPVLLAKAATLESPRSSPLQSDGFKHAFSGMESPVCLCQCEFRHRVLFPPFARAAEVHAEISLHGDGGQTLSRTPPKSLSRSRRQGAADSCCQRLASLSEPLPGARLAACDPPRRSP